MAASVYGLRKWEVDRDEQQYRTYKVQWLVNCLTTDGPFAVLNAAGLPAPGAPWNFHGDYDPWCWCRPTTTCKKHAEKEGERTSWWLVEQTFSNKPLGPGESRCADTPIEDPLLEPVKVSGTFTQAKREAVKDRFGNPVHTSSHELIRGPHNEWDEAYPTVSMEQNVPELELGLLSQMINTVNRFPLWGLGPRRIKLSSITWSKEYHGACSVYYKRKFDFDINFDTWDRDLLDEGTKVLRGHWDAATGEWVLDAAWIDPFTSTLIMPDPRNPNHFDRYKDRNGENTRVVLDGGGKPYDPRGDQITGAPGCPDGAPTKWTLLGFTGAPVEMTWDAGSTRWGGPALISLLSYSTGPPEKWTLEHSAFPGVFWDCPIADWSCMGPNYFTRRDPATTGPATVMVEAVETPAGKIHVEKYHDSDLLLLGIPATF